NNLRSCRSAVPTTPPRFRDRQPRQRQRGERLPGPGPALLGAEQGLVRRLVSPAGRNPELVGRFIARRVGLGVLTLFGVLVLVFLLTHFLPGNPALVKAGQYANPKAVAAIEHQMGLDRPLAVQFRDYLAGLAHLDLGTSYNTGQSVAGDLRVPLPATIELALWSTVIAGLVGIPLGIWAGLRAGSPRDWI